MPGATIFDLPTELLQKSFEYVDWDRSEHLTPHRPDIINISLTCRDLRRAVLPILFRNVTLKLRWVNGALVEPASLRLRQQKPHLAKYARCIYVDTLFGHFKDPRAKMKSFAVPGELQHWLDSIPSLSNAAGSISHSPDSGIVNSVAARLLETPQCNDLLQHAPEDVQFRLHELAYTLSEQILATPRALSNAENDASASTDPRDLIGDETLFDDGREEALLATSTETNIRTRSKSRDLRFQIDAIFVLLLCFPPRLNCLVFESVPTDRMDTLQNQFSLQLAAWAFKIFGGHLTEVTMKTSPLRGNLRLSQGNPDLDMQNKIISDALINLEAIQYLTLTVHGRAQARRSEVQSLSHWHAIADRITNLDLRDVDGASAEFVQFIEKFTNLEHLTLGQIDLVPSRAFPRQPGQSYAAVWLSFLIDLRRKLPNVEFDVHDADLGTRISLSASGVRWLLQEAVPKGSNVGFDRETRLMEDFESFTFLWTAEDSDRGRDAREARKDGWLVDQAMASRWRGLYTGKKG